MPARIAFVFPGQAAHRPGMVAAWTDHPARRVFDEVGRASGLDLATVGDDADLCGRSTAVAQPAIHAASLAAFTALTDVGIRPDVVAGHSLGEVTAAVAAGVFTPADGAAVVAERGRAMGDACAAMPGAMAAILRLDLEDVEAVLASLPDVAIANHNAPGQVVVAGPPDGVAEAGEAARERGGRVMPLDVEGAFHSPAMTPAMVRLDGMLRRLDLADPAVPLVSGIDGHPRASAEGVAGALVDGVLAPVRWVDVQHVFVDLRIDLLVEVGPGGVLTGCAKRTIPDIPRVAVAGPDDLDAVRTAIADLDPTTVLPDLQGARA